MGFGVHECVAEGTKDLVLMVGDTSCEAIHSHVHTHMHIHTETGILHSHPHSCEEHHHVGDEQDSGHDGCCEHSGECHHCGENNHCGFHNAQCCNTNVFVVTDVQYDSNNHLDKTFLPDCIIEYPLAVAEVLHQNYTTEEIIDSSPLLLFNSHSYLSVWRL